MNEKTTFTNNMDTLFTDLHDFVSTDTVLGNPLSVENKTLVPVMSVTMGYGSTGMSTKVQNNSSNNANNATNGMGLGARVTTNAVMVIENDSVSMLPVNEKNNMEQLMNKLPDAISSLSQGFSNGGMMNQNNNQGSSKGQQGDSKNTKSQGMSSDKQNSSNQQS
ncbi:GerW family sporulation protein [Clostridium sp. UBA4548]|uniref:GerW family sporulation protein n=1 Tax=Clostridium sp. UBA4548 TaxID=1946361 RepID=UPI0025C6E145|nr:spore germination protein GerW family protein [Clostridium sp. UBA4548]